MSASTEQKGDLLAQIMAMQATAGQVTASNEEKSKKTEAKGRAQRRKSKELEVSALAGLTLGDAGYIKEQFAKYDTDGSGDIDLSELKEAVKGMKGVASSSLNDRIFANMIDRWADIPAEKFPKTGLSLTAFEGLVKELRAPEDFDKYDKDPQELLDEHFNFVDTDGSGMITEVELMSALRKATGADISASMFTTLYNNFGKGPDGEPSMENGARAFNKDAFSQMVKAIKKGTWDKETWKPPGASAPGAAPAPSS